MFTICFRQSCRQQAGGVGCVINSLFQHIKGGGFLVHVHGIHVFTRDLSHAFSFLFLAISKSNGIVIVFIKFQL